MPARSPTRKLGSQDQSHFGQCGCYTPPPPGETAFDFEPSHRFQTSFPIHSFLENQFIIRTDNFLQQLERRLIKLRAACANKPPCPDSYLISAYIAIGHHHHHRQNVLRSRMLTNAQGLNPTLGHCSIVLAVHCQALDWVIAPSSPLGHCSIVLVVHCQALRFVSSNFSECSVLGQPFHCTLCYHCDGTSFYV